MPSSVPDVIYALASIAGDEGCSRWCAQEVYVNEQSYSTAEKRLTPQRKRSCWVPTSPRWASTATLLKMSRPSVILTMIVENKIGYILDYGPTVCHVIKLELASIKADSAAAAKLTDHVYCLLKVQTDMGRPNRPNMQWRTQAFVDPQSAANAAREWFLEQQTLADWEGDEDFGNFTDAYDPATKRCDSDVVLHTGYGTFRVMKVMLP